MTPPAGIAATVAIYLNVLEDLARRRKFNIYVQPVAPVRAAPPRALELNTNVHYDFPPSFFRF